MEDAWKRISGELVGWPPANCSLAPEVMKMVNGWYSGFCFDKTAPVTSKSYSFDPGRKFSKLYTLNLFNFNFQKLFLFISFKIKNAF